MKLNCSTSLVGNKVILVPYKKKHVSKYHQWMQRKDLQETTASEPLTEEEEYAMQESWLIDENKCTFIILDKEIKMKSNDEIEAMIGDTNLYLSDDEGKKIAECGIMIAENGERSKGKGYEAMMLMMKYAVDFLNTEKFEAKIGLSNAKSVNLFEKMKFEMVEKNEIFEECTLSVNVSENWKTWLNENIKQYSITDYLE